MAKAKTKQHLTIESEELRARLQELEDTLEAIRSGAVDAIVTSGPEGDRVYTLEGADHAYHTMVESMNEGAVTVLTDGTILYSNPQFGKMTGASTAGILGKPFHDFVQASDYALWDGFILQAGSDGLKAEVRLGTQSAFEIPVQISATPIDLGGTKAFALVVTDLTESRRYEEIVAAERLSRYILEQGMEGVAVCVNGRIIRASRRLHEICGSNPLMQPFDKLFPLRMSDSAPFSVEIPQSGNVVKGAEVSYRNPDGKSYSLILNAAPLYGDDHNILGCLVSLTDITERKQAEEALYESRQRLAVIVDSIADGFYALDRSWRFTHVNDATLRHMGKTREEILGRTLFDVYPEARDSVIETEYARAMESGEPRHFQTPSLIAERTLEIHAYPGSEVLSVLFRDVTEQTLLATALRESEKSLRRANEHLEQRVRERTMDLHNLTENLSTSRDDLRRLASELVLAEERERKRIAVTLHDEVAQTLAAARMRIDLLRSLPGDNEYRQLIEQAQELLSHSIRQTRALMTDISNPVLYDLGLPSAVEALAEQIKDRHGIQVQCAFEGNLSLLSQDLKVMVFQVVKELVQNVIKHSGAHGAHIRIIEAGHSIRAIVADDGAGFNGDKNDAPDYVGGGFGLFSIRERVKSFNGNIQIKSRPGIGSEVTVELPKSAGSITAQRKAETQRKSKKRKGVHDKNV